MTTDTDQPPPIYRLISTLGLLTMTFIVGALVADSGIWPYEPILRRGFQALRVSVSNVVRLDIHETGDIWQPARTKLTGVTRYDESKAQPSYTLYASSHDTTGLLIDDTGKVVHTWDVPFERVFGDADHISDPIGDRIEYIRRLHVYPDGDLLVLYEGYGDTPWGLGLAMVDVTGAVKWTFKDRAHHDFEVGEDGTITTLTHRMRDTATEPIELPYDVSLEGWIVEDFVVQLDASGKELRRVNLLDALAQSQWREVIGQTKFPTFEKWDVLHTNDASVVGAEFASHHSFAEPGMVLVSMRTVDLIGMIDMTSGQFVWASRGVWEHQHDPDPLPDGWLMLFDNFGNPSTTGRSRVLEYHPTTGAVRWTYTGGGEPFESLTRSSQHIMPNGNVFVVESDGARMMEVQRDGTAVWAFRNPAIRDDQVAIIADATRYPRGYIKFTLGN